MDRRQSGLTLVELLMAVSILGIVGLVFFSIVHTTLESSAYAGNRNEVNETGRVALQRMTQMIQATNRVLLPFERAALDSSTSHVLCVALGTDNDGDGRIDEDSYDVYQDGTKAGLPGIDDDGDGTVDEGSVWDDDEDGTYDEDAVDGKDNDGDGRIDEDWGYDMNKDGASGIQYIDDDGDGTVDEGSRYDDDEDGRNDEDPIEPIAYYVDTSQRPPTLVERHPTQGTTVLATNLYYEETGNRDQGFRVTRINLMNGTVLIRIRLRLLTDDGEIVDFTTSAVAGNCARRPAWQWGGEVPS